MKALIYVAGFVLSATSVFANAETCTYTLDRDSVHVGWTAFKTMQKVGVNGSFKKVTVKGADSASTLTKLFSGLDVSADVTSPDTGNPTRDQTLTDFFFKKLVGDSATGKIQSVSEKDKTFHLLLKMNGQVKHILMKYSEDKDGMTATGDIDLAAFKGMDALQSLSQKCGDLHKGPDGVSKTWPTVTLTLKGKVKSDCH